MPLHALAFKGVPRTFLASGSELYDIGAEIRVPLKGSIRATIRAFIGFSIGA